MPLYRRLPKRGFRSQSPDLWCIINLYQIQTAIDRGRINSSAPVNELALLQAGLLGHGKKYARVLGEGEIRSRIDLEVLYASGAAISKIERIGGTVKVLSRVDVKDILPSRFVFRNRRDDRNYRREIITKLPGDGTMHVKTHIESNQVSFKNDIKMQVEITFADTDNLPQDVLDEYSIYFQGLGADSKTSDLVLSKVFMMAARNKGEFKTEVIFKPLEKGEIILNVGIEQGGHKLIRRSHVLQCT